MTPPTPETILLAEIVGAVLVALIGILLAYLAELE